MEPLAAHKRPRDDGPAPAALSSNWVQFQRKRGRDDASSPAAPSSSSSSSAAAPSASAPGAEAPGAAPPAPADAAEADAGARRLASALATLRGPFPPASQALVGEEARFVALDCEMVGVGSEGRSALALVVLCDWHGRVLFRSFCRPAEAVTDLRTFVSGVREEHLRGAPDFRAVQARVCELLSGKLLVGHGLKNDLEALLLHHDVRARRDTAHYPPLMRATPFGTRKSRKLRDLAKEHLGADIQGDGAAHDPAEDARAALAVYKVFRLQWERDEAKLRARAKGKSKGAAKGAKGGARS